MTTQETIDKAVAWAVSVANDPSHGYDQSSRWGPNYDCSSFVISAWQQAGVPVKDAGASYTGNMLSSFLKCGFRNVLALVNVSTGAGLQKGDVLLNSANHTEMYIGDGKDVKASINERGGTTGGQTGDQTGREIYIGPYYNYPWNYVLRYFGGESEEKGADELKPDPAPAISGLPALKRGDKGETVRAAQFLLNGRGASCGIYGADGDFGPATEAAVFAYQRRNSLEADGIVGPATWSKLLGL